MPTPILVDRSWSEATAITTAIAVEASQVLRDSAAQSRLLTEMVPVLVAEAMRYGVDPAVILSQSVHETGWGVFGGVVPPRYHNTCGLKTRSGGRNADPSAHQRFPSWHAGARAHAQHLYAYAGGTLDDGDLELTPRAIWVRQANATHGPAVHVEDLGGRWAPSSSYGERVATRAQTLLTVAGVTQGAT